MGCGCRRKKTVPLTKVDIQKKQSLYNERVNICKKCSFSTKNSHPKFSKYLGITDLSKCTKSGVLLKQCLTNPNFKCPAKSF